ncbi:hypothetical protein GF319_00235 [Candidatus Bathyarchaeota archaeon]|nr:hypothetical protein [Candidatus Bathyarchaeota archaeon]
MKVFNEYNAYDRSHPDQMVSPVPFPQHGTQAPRICIASEEIYLPQ